MEIRRRRQHTIKYTAAVGGVLSCIQQRQQQPQRQQQYINTTCSGTAELLRSLVLLRQPQAYDGTRLFVEYETRSCSCIHRVRGARAYSARTSAASCRSRDRSEVVSATTVQPTKKQQTKTPVTPRGKRRAKALQAYFPSFSGRVHPNQKLSGLPQIDRSPWRSAIGDGVRIASYLLVFYFLSISAAAGHAKMAACDSTGLDSVKPSRGAEAFWWPAA